MQTEFLIYFLITVRIIAMFISSPIFSISQIPSLVKVGLAMIIGYLVVGIVNTGNIVLPSTSIELVLIIGKEAIIGLSIGFISTLIFNAVRISAQFMDFSIGFSMAQYYDPSMAGSSTLLEGFFNWLALIIFLTFNFHQVLLMAVIKSFQIIPPGITALNTNIFSYIFDIFSKGFLLSIQLAAPILIVLFLTDFTLGLISRTVPQIQVFILGMPIKILAGLLAISVILPGLVHIYVQAFENMQGDLARYFNLFPAILLMASDDKTEEATSKKLQEAKKKGQVPKSIELNSAAVLLAIALVFSIYGSTLYTNGINLIVQSIHYVTSNPIGYGDIEQLFLYMLKNGLTAAAPIVLTVLAVGIISNILQTGFIMTSETLKPKFEKINPVEGFKRLFSKRALMELGKSILKICLLSYIAFSFIKSNIFNILETSDLNAFGVYPFVKSLTDTQLKRMVIVMLGIGVLDLIFQRRQYKKDLRMTKQEVKEEFKQMEGDPQIKSRIRQKQREISMRRMMHEVPKATVVITNPTHFAVALKYDKGANSAPLVLAKGADNVALKIKEIARENKVPIIENKQLARTLYARVEINETIPMELYQAVAEIIAYVYSLKKM